MAEKRNAFVVGRLFTITGIKNIARLGAITKRGRGAIIHARGVDLQSNTIRHTVEGVI